MAATATASTVAGGSKAVTPVELTMVTDFPYSNNVSLKLSWSASSVSAVQLNLRLRIPGWLTPAGNLSVWLNGAAHSSGTLLRSISDLTCTGVPTIKTTLYTLFEELCMVNRSHCAAHRRFSRRRTRTLSNPDLTGIYHISDLYSRTHSSDSLRGAGKPGNFLEIERPWSQGDELSFVLPEVLTLSLYTGVDQIAGHEGKRYALKVGPIVMACVSTKLGVRPLFNFSL